MTPRRACQIAWLHARRPFMSLKLRRTRYETFQGLRLKITPQVHDPIIFRSGAFLAEWIGRHEQCRPTATSHEVNAIDMGTGSGLSALMLARRGFRVAAIDLNPFATSCATFNAHLNNLHHNVLVVCGDLLTGLRNRRVDLVTFNPPFYCGEPTHPADIGWRSQDVLQRFADQLPTVLHEDGRALVVFSSRGDTKAFHQAFSRPSLAIRALKERDFGNEVMTIYEVTVRSPHA